MDVGGLARAFLLKDQLHIKPCKRCGLHYDEREPACPHCGDLDDHGLKALLEEQAEAQEGNVAMGKVFLLIGAVLAAFLVLGFLTL